MHILPHVLTSASTTSTKHKENSIKINNKEIKYLNFSIDIQFQSQLPQYDSL